MDFKRIGRSWNLLARFTTHKPDGFVAEGSASYPEIMERAKTHDAIMRELWYNKSI